MRLTLKPVEVDVFTFTGDTVELDKWLTTFDTPDKKVGANWIKTRDQIKINIDEPFGTGRIVVAPSQTIIRWPNSTFSVFPKDMYELLFVEQLADPVETPAPSPTEITYSPRSK